MDFSELSCHFVWKPDEGESVKDENFEKIMSHTQQKLKNECDIKLLAQPLLAYLHCKKKDKDHVKGLKIIDDFLLLLKDRKPVESVDGYEIVGLGNKAFILKEMRQIDEAQNILKSIKKLDELPDEQQAVIYGVHGYSLSLFGASSYHEGQQMYIKAKSLDKKNYSWCFGVGYLAGRIRRQEEGTKSLPTEMEEENFRQACELSDWKKAIPIVFLAETILTRGREFTSRVGDPKLYEEAKELYKRAYRLNSTSPVVLKKCGKAFSILDEDELGIECLKKAIELDPESSQAFHWLGQIYEFGERTKNLTLAEKYYSKAVTAGRRRNFFAECDLGRARKKADVTYDSVKHYEAMKPFYMEDEKRLVMINKAINDIKDYNRKKKQCKRAERKYRK